MQVKALKSFHGRYGLIRQGMRFDCDPSYLRGLLRNNLVEVCEGQAVEPGPTANTMAPPPPYQGKADPGGEGATPADTDPPRAAGRGITSSSLRADLASRAETAKPSSGGAKRGRKPKTPTE